MRLSTTRPHALRSLLALALVAVAGLAMAAPGDLYVTSDASNKVRRYDGTTGAFLGTFCLSAGANGQMAIHFGGTNNRALVGHNSFGVEERDVATGALVKTYNAGGGWQWAGLYAPTGEVFVGDMLTNDVRAYDANTAAFIRVVCPVSMPADMRMGPDGNLWVCSWGNMDVEVFDPVTGAPQFSIPLPLGALPNDVAFHPVTNDILVTAMNTNMGYRFDWTSHLISGQFVGTGWARPHGIEFSPFGNRFLCVDGVTGQVHEFHGYSLLETNPAFLVPAPGDKIVDLAFQPAGGPTPARSSTWGRVKTLFR
ncbi:MAG: hypothetical protein U0704_12580 [Candidatus Eisenbacteria bacterium]